MTGKIESIQVGRPRVVSWNGRDVKTSIFKDPVKGRVKVGKLNIEGDEQSDLSVHGGPDMAVYLYSKEHYVFWEEELDRRDLTPGIFGENITATGLDEKKIRVGDRFQMGDAVLEVTQPRRPCFKLAMRMEDPKIVKKFAQSDRYGIYFRVIEEGTIEIGDGIQLLSQNSDGISLHEKYDLMGKS